MRYDYYFLLLLAFFNFSCTEPDIPSYPDVYNCKIVSMDAHSGIQKDIISGTADSIPKFSPDCTKIMFFRQKGVDLYSICVINADGTNLVEVVSVGDFPSYYDWSPDGRYIYFNSNGIMRYDTYNNTFQNITSYAGIFSISPDGSKIAYWSYSGLCVINTDGTNNSIIYNSGINPISITWRKDGEKIAFGISVYNVANYIIECNTNGTGVNILYTTSNTISIQRVKYSPDGQKLLLMTRESNVYGSTLMVCNNDGSNLIILDLEANNAYILLWSADSNQISYAADNNIYIINTDGSNKRIVCNINSISITSWSTDGNTFLGTKSYLVQR